MKLGYVNGGKQATARIRLRKLTSVAINAFCDFALALFPLSFIKNLNLRFHRKVVLSLLMCCGVV